MADLAVFSAHLYDFSSGVYIRTEDGDTTLFDGETTPPDGDTFEIGDFFDFPAPDGVVGTSVVNTVYHGFLTNFDGELVPVLLSDDVRVQFAFGNDLYIVLSRRDAADVTPPGTIDFFATLNTGAFTVCFLPGTGIATPEGRKPVETLRIGDTVLTADGREVPVKWIGHQTISTRFRSAPQHQPVRIRAGALGAGHPARDLCLTADHALMIEGLLVNAGALVGASGIARMTAQELGATYVVYHIETEGHDIILAEDTPTETFIDYAGRAVFDNHADYVALYGEDRTLAEQPYPRVTSARQLPAGLRARLGLDRAA